MTAFSPTQSEILDRLQDIPARWGEIADAEAALERRIADERAKLAAKKTALRDEEKTLWEQWNQSNTNSSKKKTRLIFLPDEKTIRWDGKSIQLSKIPRKIVRALYRAKKRRMLITTLETRVWGKNAPSPGNVKTTLHALKKALKAHNFPYEIKIVKCKQETIQSTDQNTNKIKNIKIRAATKGLVLKKIKN